jgi:hypothetical protein
MVSILPRHLDETAKRRSAPPVPEREKIVRSGAVGSLRGRNRLARLFVNHDRVPASSGDLSMRPRLSSTALALAAGLSLAGCSVYDDGYGYGGISVGYGHGGYGYYDQYYDPYWDYYAATPYWGWYDGYYYPGTGIYIYDQWRRPFRWSDRHRRYWSDRRSYWDRRGHWEGRRDWRDNWRDFRRDDRRDWRDNRRNWRDERRDWGEQRRNWHRGSGQFRRGNRGDVHRERGDNAERRRWRERSE